MLERLGPGLEDGRDLPQPRVGLAQLCLKFGVVGVLLDKSLVEVSGRPQQLAAQRLEVLRFEHVVVADLRQVSVDGFACLAEVAQGAVALALGPPALGDGLGPFPGDAGHAARDDQKQSQRQARDQRPAPAPAPAPLERPRRPGLDRFAAQPAVQVVGDLPAVW